MTTKSQRDELSKMLMEERKKVDNWDQVSEKLYDGKIDQSHLSRIASPSDDHWPKKKSIRDLLIPPPGDDEEGPQTIRAFGTKIDADRFRAAVPVNERLEHMLKEIKLCECGKYFKVWLNGENKPVDDWCGECIPF